MNQGIRVYIAGPYTKGDVGLNVRNAITMGNIVRDAGLTNDQFRQLL